MALQTFNGAAIGVDGVSVTGMTQITSVSDGQEYGNIARAKKSNGDLGAIFMSKGVHTSEISGYANAVTPVALGGTISGVEGGQKIMSSQLQASNQDFVKVTVTGKGLG